ncbi:MAG: redox-sensitive transcriptional activator SoxR [Acidimicrobiia bacterium]|nr:redox-sensitive transcriptional activator SoxR [Acidimicrobiia bacterium]
MNYDDLLTISETADRSGFSPSALRYYEKEGLIQATRTSGGQRRFERQELRRLAFIAAARHLGVPLEQIRRTLDLLPEGRHPTKADWSKISRSWRHRLDDEIKALEMLRDGLDGCIGCGCLSLQRCRLSNPNDSVAARGPGAAFLPKALHPKHDAG